LVLTPQKVLKLSQSLTLKIKGLFTSNNEYSEVPEGSLLVADNIDILKDSIAEPRRGFDRVSGEFTLPGDRANTLFFYEDKLFAHHGPLGSPNTVSYLDSGTWTAVGTYAAPTGTRMRSLESGENLLFTTATGIRKLDAFNGTPRMAGGVKALDILASISASSSTWLQENFRVAYRVIWGYKDANNNLILGAPSQRESIKNTGTGAKAVDLRITIPAGVSTAWFVQVYRSSEIDNTSSEIEPNDELGLVFETNPDSTDLTNGYIDITDIVPDDLRGATIYTAASQEGLAFQNEAPPLAKDMARFRESVFYANTTSKHRYFLTLLASDGSNGLANDDTITIGGVTYTAKGSENIASAHFRRYTGGSAAQNIKDTVYSLIRVINRHSSSTVYAFHLSGADDLPGKILLEERGIGGSAFAITSSAASTTFSPSIPSSGTGESSTNDRFKNGLFWSKPSQAESVPLVNFVEVGSKENEILRIIPLREALYIFKEREGIYRLTGYYPNFSIDLLDSSATLIGTETPAILNNQIMCLTDQGVTMISDSTKVISRPIEQDLLQLFGQDLTLLKQIAFGLAYETDRKYYLFLPQRSTDTSPPQAYVYNTFTNTWVRHILQKSCGVVHSNQLYLGDALSNYVNKERKSFSYLDYVDFGFETTITAISQNVLSISSGSDNIEIGDIIFESTNKFAIVTEVNTLTSTVRVETEPGFSIGSVDVLKAIKTELKWTPQTLGNPGILKHFHTATLLFKSDFNGTGFLKFNSELSQFDETVPLEGVGIGSWGLFSWGGRPWGGATLRRPIRQWVPRNKQRCSQLTLSFSHAYGYSAWQLQGITLFAVPGSDRVTR
jgi:hypothetical protein